VPQRHSRGGGHSPHAEDTRAEDIQVQGRGHHAETPHRHRRGARNQGARRREAEGSGGEAEGRNGEAKGSNGEAEDRGGKAEGRNGEAQGPSSEAESPDGEAEGPSGEAQGSSSEAGFGDEAEGTGCKAGDRRDGQGRGEAGREDPRHACRSLEAARGRQAGDGIAHCREAAHGSQARNRIARRRGAGGQVARHAGAGRDAARAACSQVPHRRAGAPAGCAGPPGVEAHRRGRGIADAEAAPQRGGAGARYAGGARGHSRAADAQGAQPAQAEGRGTARRAG
jgi:hypothetical protein